MYFGESHVPLTSECNAEKCNEGFDNALGDASASGKTREKTVARHAFSPTANGVVYADHANQDSSSEFVSHQLIG